MLQQSLLVTTRFITRCPGWLFRQNRDISSVTSRSLTLWNTLSPFLKSSRQRALIQCGTVVAMSRGFMFFATAAHERAFRVGPWRKFDMTRPPAVEPPVP